MGNLAGEMSEARGGITFDEPATRGDVHTRWCLRIGKEVKGKKNYIGHSGGCRYCLRIGKEVKGKKSHSGGCLGTPVTKFEGARVWMKRGDAARYMKHQNVRQHRGLEIVEVTCAIGAPFAIYTEK